MTEFERSMLDLAQFARSLRACGENHIDREQLNENMKKIVNVLREHGLSFSDGAAKAFVQTLTK